MERSRYAKFCGDLDAVQDALSQAYGNKQVSQALENPTNRKSSEEIYKEIAGGKLLDDCVEIIGGKNLEIDLPKYGDSKWYVDVNTGEVFLEPGFEYEDKIYANKTDIQNGGAEKPTNYTGYYADIDGNGVVDGVIFADLAVGGSGQWGNSNGTFTIPIKPMSSFKKYEIGEGTIQGKPDEQVVTIVPAESSEGSGAKDRFYVMTLEDIGGDAGNYFWYFSAINAGIYDWNTIVSNVFGSGKRNTENMIAKWNNDIYGKKAKNDDIWGVVDSKRNELQREWFVPSKEEWSAFIYNLKELNMNNFNTTIYCPKKEVWYLTSSLFSKDLYWGVDFRNTWMGSGTFSSSGYVRLATTF